MTQVIQQVNLNLIPQVFGANSVLVPCSQYDKSYRVIQFNVYNGRELYNIPSTCTVLIRGTKKDLTGFEYNCVFSGSQVIFPLEPQITVLSGKVPAELRIVNGEELIGSANFLFMVEPSPLTDDTIISETQLPLLEQSLQASAQAESYKNLAEQSATEASASASEASDSATIATTKSEESNTYALKSEGYAVGEQNGVPVGSDSIYYENNAKWYSEHGGTNNYSDLLDKPSINDVTLEGNKTLEELGVPLKTSELTNDSGFISSIPSEYITESELSDELDNYATLAQLATKADASSLSAVALSGSYNDLTNKPTIPSKTSELTNDSNYQNATQVESLIDSHLSSTYKAGGSIYFADLPTPSSQYLGMVYDIKDAFVTNSLFEEGSGISYPAGTDVAIIIDNGVYKYDVLSGFVDLSNYATQTDLSNGLATKQNTLSSGNGISIANNTVSNTGVLSVNNQNGNVTITVPTKTSDLTNDSGFITSVPVTSVNGRTGAITGLQEANLVTSVSSSSTDSQYPSAKCLYDLVGDVETLLASI